MIIRCLSKDEIKKIYQGRKVKPDYGIRPGFDYVVISIECVPELKPQSENSIQYWIISDEEILMPYDVHYFKTIDGSPSSCWVIDINLRCLELSHPKWTQHGYVEDYFDEPEIEKEYKIIMGEIFAEAVENAKKKNIKLNLAIKNPPKYKGNENVDRMTFTPWPKSFINGKGILHFYVPKNTSNSEMLFEIFEKNLNLPKKYIKNWSILESSLCDLNSVKEDRIVIIHKDGIPDLNNNDLKKYIEILSQCILYWRKNIEKSIVPIFTNDGDHGKLYDLFK